MRASRLRGARRRLSRLSLHVTALLGLSAAACSSDSLDPNRTPVDTVVVLPANATVTVGASVALQAEARDGDGNVITRQAFWAAADSDIATVSGDGIVTAKRMGQVQIAASVSGKSGISSITVARTPVASVRLLPGNASLTVGGTVQLTAEALDAAGSVLAGRVISWTSSNAAVASVTTAGLVTALVSGASIISAVCEGKTGLTSVNVSGTAPQPSPGPAPSTLRDTIVVTPASATIGLGKTVQLSAVFYDANGRVISKDFSWSTSNSHIATVSSKGKVTGRGPGTATITAAAGGLRGTSRITVR